MNLLNRFLNYLAVDTRSNPNSTSSPSSEGQLTLARIIVNELHQLGLTEIELDNRGYIMATLPSNTEKETSVIGFIAHLDTSPDFSGENVKPRVVNSYDGGDIVLNNDTSLFLKPDEFPELKKYVGDNLVTTSGDTLLGADNKAGIAIIISAMEYLQNNPLIKHGKIRIAFTPDEEIGRGADYFDVAKFGADFAYTVDGGELGELEFENFNAARALVVFNGRSVHPGYAKGKMKNSIKAANLFVAMLPVEESPEHSSGYEGFFHLASFNGSVERSEIEILIRDFDGDNFIKRKNLLLDFVNRVNSSFGQNTAEITITDQYHNMREKIEPVMHVVELASKAMELAGVQPLIRPIRGGTDGARLSYMGLPTPNLFTGGHNFHGPYEFISIQSMEKAVKVVVNIATLAASDNT